MANGYWIEAAGAQVKVAPEAMSRLTDAATRLFATVGQQPDQKVADRWHDDLCDSLLDWHDVTDVDGQQIPFSRHNLEAVMTESPVLFWAVCGALKDIADGAGSAPKH